MKTLFNKVLILGVVFIGFGFMLAYAADEPTGETVSTTEQQVSSIVFPIPELGNCVDKTACRAFCDTPENAEVCTTFAEQHNLISRDKAEKTRKLLQAARLGGPGGCKDHKVCRAYCSDQSHFDECATFARRNGFENETKLKESERIREVIKDGKGLPGNCTDETSCKAFCQKPENVRVCVEFARRAEFIPSDQADRVLKMAELQEQGKTPGQCKTKEECETYCHQQEHFEECTQFNEEAGFIRPDEAERMRKTQGQGPGGCRGEACRDFCQKEENIQTCNDFAREHKLTEPLRPRPSGEVSIPPRPSGIPSIRPLPSKICRPRPACLDAEPACKIMEPAEGWCSRGNVIDRSPRPIPQWTQKPEPQRYPLERPEVKNNRGLYTTMPEPRERPASGSQSSLRAFFGAILHLFVYY